MQSKIFQYHIFFLLLITSSESFTDTIYKNDLAQVNMFLGLSYLFEGDLIKGIEHLLIAKRSTENLKVIEIIDLYLNEADKAI